MVLHKSTNSPEPGLKEDSDTRGSAGRQKNTKGLAWRLKSPSTQSPAQGQNSSPQGGRRMSAAKLLLRNLTGSKKRGKLDIERRCSHELDAGTQSEESTAPASACSLGFDSNIRHKDAHTNGESRRRTEDSALEVAFNEDDSDPRLSRGWAHNRQENPSPQQQLQAVQHNSWADGIAGGAAADKDAAMQALQARLRDAELQLDFWRARAQASPSIKALHSRGTSALQAAVGMDSPMVAAGGGCFYPQEPGLARGLSFSNPVFEEGTPAKRPSPNPVFEEGTPARQPSPSLDISLPDDHDYFEEDHGQRWGVGSQTEEQAAAAVALSPQRCETPALRAAADAGSPLSTVSHPGMLSYDTWPPSPAPGAMALAASAPRQPVFSPGAEEAAAACDDGLTAAGISGRTGSAGQHGSPDSAGRGTGDSSLRLQEGFPSQYVNPTALLSPCPSSPERNGCSPRGGGSPRALRASTDALLARLAAAAVPKDAAPSGAPLEARLPTPISSTPERRAWGAWGTAKPTEQQQCHQEQEDVEAQQASTKVEVARQVGIKVASHTEVEVASHTEVEVASHTEVEVASHTEVEVASHTEVEVCKEVGVEVASEMEVGVEVVSEAAAAAAPLLPPPASLPASASFDDAASSVSYATAMSNLGSLSDFGSAQPSAAPSAVASPCRPPRASATGGGNACRAACDPECAVDALWAAVAEEVAADMGQRVLSHQQQQEEDPAPAEEQEQEQRRPLESQPQQQQQQEEGRASAAEDEAEQGLQQPLPDTALFGGWQLPEGEAIMDASWAERCEDASQLRWAVRVLQGMVQQALALRVGSAAASPMVLAEDLPLGTPLTRRASLGYGGSPSASPLYARQLGEMLAADSGLGELAGQLDALAADLALGVDDGEEPSGSTMSEQVAGGSTSGASPRPGPNSTPGADAEEGLPTELRATLRDFRAAQDGLQSYLASHASPASSSRAATPTAAAAASETDTSTPVAGTMPPPPPHLQQLLLARGSTPCSSGAATPKGGAACAEAVVAAVAGDVRQRFALWRQLSDAQVRCDQLARRESDSAAEIRRLAALAREEKEAAREAQEAAREAVNATERARAEAEEERAQRQLLAGRLQAAELALAAAQGEAVRLRELLHSEQDAAAVAIAAVAVAGVPPPDSSPKRPRLRVHTSGSGGRGAGVMQEGLGSSSGRSPGQSLSPAGLFIRPSAPIYCECGACSACRTAGRPLPLLSPTASEAASHGTDLLDHGDLLRLLSPKSAASDATGEDHSDSLTTPGGDSARAGTGEEFDHSDSPGRQRGCDSAPSATEVYDYDHSDSPAARGNDGDDSAPAATTTAAGGVQKPSGGGGSGSSSTTATTAVSGSSTVGSVSQPSSPWAVEEACNVLAPLPHGGQEQADCDGSKEDFAFSPSNKDVAYEQLERTLTPRTWDTDALRTPPAATKAAREDASAGAAVAGGNEEEGGQIGACWPGDETAHSLQVHVPRSEARRARLTILQDSDDDRSPSSSSAAAAGADHGGGTYAVVACTRGATGVKQLASLFSQPPSWERQQSLEGYRSSTTSSSGGDAKPPGPRSSFRRFNSSPADVSKPGNRPKPTTGSRSKRGASLAGGAGGLRNRLRSVGSWRSRRGSEAD